MRKHLFLLMFAIVASTSICNSQKLQTYQGTQAFNSMIGAIAGTEKYSYFIDEDGGKLKQGAYSFVGDKSVSNDIAQISGKLTINANFVKGNLDGAYSASASHVGKDWSYTKGWQAYNCSSKLTGSFAGGKPNGTFMASYNGNMVYSGNVTMKNGKYVGSYSYSGAGDNRSLWKIKGQLTADGKLTGNWSIENIVSDWHANYTFLNDVLIGGKNNMTAQLQSVAKQFAEGKINEAQLEQKGFVLATDSLPLVLFINYLLFVDNDDFGLDKLEGYDFSDYGNKVFYEIVQVNSFNREGFDNICSMYRKDPDDTFFTIQNKHGLNCINCTDNFAQQYGTHPELVGKDGWPECIYFTNSQYDRFVALRDSVAIVMCSEEAIKGLSNYKKNKSNAESAITYAEAMRGNTTFTEELKKYYKEYHKYLDKRYTYRYSSDSMYIFRINWTGHEEAINVDISGAEEYYEWLNTQYQRAIKCDNAKDAIIRKIGDIRTYSYGSYNYAKANLITSYIKEKTPYDSWNQDITLNDYENIIKQSLLIDSIDIKSRMINNGLKGKLLKTYTQEERTFSNKICNNMLSVGEKLRAGISLGELQDGLLLWIKQNKLITTRHDSILNNYSKVYANECKIYKEQYKTQYNPSPAIIDQESADQEVQKLNEIYSFQTKFVEYIAQLQIAQGIDLEVATKCGKKYSDILKSWQDKYVKGAVLTDDLDKSTTGIKVLQNQGKEVVRYVVLRQQCDSLSTVLLNMCGKQYGDVTKVYQAKVKSMLFVPDMSSGESIQKDYSVLQEFKAYQMQLQQYIQNRQKVGALNQSIVTLIGNAKNVKKLYALFYKSLPIAWVADSDNFKTIEDTIATLQKVETTLQTHGANSYEAQLKKAKTAEDFKKVLEL